MTWNANTFVCKFQYVRKKRLNVTIKQNSTKVFNFDSITKETNKEHNANQSQIPDHPCIT